MNYGCTFSPKQLIQLGLDPIESLHAICTWPITYIRVGCYWDEIQPNQHKFEFEEIKSYLKIIKQANKKAVIVVGMKSPRWPEFHIPEWCSSLNEEQLQLETLKFIKSVIKELKNHKEISHWQIENEPFDESGRDNKKLSNDFIEQEIKLAKSLDRTNGQPRPCIVTIWANDTISRQTLEKTAQNSSADIIGLDIYYKVYLASLFGKHFYRGPQFSNNQIKNLISKINKPIWITELQAEPWEKSAEHYQADQPLSMSLPLLKENLNNVTKLNPKVILFWGVEYWLWRQSQGDSQYIEFIENLN
jgi:hypothetical protein